MQKPATKLSTFTKKEQKLVTDYVKAHPEVCPVRSVKGLTTVLERSFVELPEGFPMEEFKDLDLKVWPKVELEQWYVHMEDGFFSRHLSKDVERSTLRFDKWKEMIVAGFVSRFPDTTVLDEVPKGMTITMQRECGHAAHYVVDGYKLAFGCKKKTCGVHGEAVAKEVVVAKAKERIEKKSWKASFKLAYRGRNRSCLTCYCIRCYDGALEC
jgi:hypothetical protein